MSKFGKKFTCWSCATKFYDLNKPNPKCPKCGSKPEDDPKKDAPPPPVQNYGDDYGEVDEDLADAPPAAAADDEDAEEEAAPDVADGPDEDY